MRIKWLMWGLVVFLLSGAGWFVSVILSAVTLGQFRTIANAFGYIAAASLPVAVLFAIFDGRKK